MRFKDNETWERCPALNEPVLNASGCKRPAVLTLENMLDRNWTLDKKYRKEKITPKNVWYLKRFSAETDGSYEAAVLLSIQTPARAHTTFYILPYAQLANRDDKDSVCFRAYSLNLHSEILQQKSAGSCDKNNLRVLREASFFKPHL